MNIMKITKKAAREGINETDEALSILHEPFINATDVKKLKIMKMINKLLDERLVFMKARDAKGTNKKA